MANLTINKRTIYNVFTSCFCAIIGITLLTFMVYCQLELTSIVDIVLWIYLGSFPIFYFLLYYSGNYLYKLKKVNLIKVFMLNYIVLYVLIMVNLLFIIIPLDEYVNDYIILGLIAAFSFLLSLIMYLKLLSAHDNDKLPKKHGSLLAS